MQEQAEFLAKNEKNFKYEIIVGDDGSTDKSIIEKNNEINNISNCRYIIRGFNSGRAAIRNFLAKTAKYEWLLFIDYGRTVHNSVFIKTYINLKDISVVYGGYIICDNNEKLKHNLRYIYEKKYKKNSVASERMKACYKNFNTCNFIVKRDIMLAFPFDERIIKYGYEDVLWGKTLYNN
ncbi:MAG: glycosyltransferase, partial [Prevotella sp.]|nr:glycosyltransferase [Prevotella sp.]